MGQLRLLEDQLGPIESVRLPKHRLADAHISEYWKAAFDKFNNEYHQYAVSDIKTAVSKIAFKWGQNNLQHFSRTFREQFSCSPRDYKRTTLGPK
ncbi:hypothetical protein BCT30_14365 [Enterovibrio norvegicus]|nr:hypothetical protein BCU46_01270 [Enterovibrio norvegicus]PMN51906.1 hypothetical protein BCT30_14365 [Enterovibrio norvegicus]TKF20014.1 helix-turn-helix domain-containing protein [Enterovibrio norvegicus]TKF36546.1 helix-turn-helix domain-containing protein [Enterovibrio norvegicus]